MRATTSSSSRPEISCTCTRAFAIHVCGVQLKGMMSMTSSNTHSLVTHLRTPPFTPRPTLLSSAFAYGARDHGIHTCGTVLQFSPCLCLLLRPTHPGPQAPSTPRRAPLPPSPGLCRRVPAALHPQPAAPSTLLTRRRCSRTPPPSSAPVGRCPTPARPPAPPPPAAAPLVRVRVRVRARV